MTGAFTIGSPNRTKETPLSRDTNLIGHWTFDEASGNALDYSGNGYTGTLNGPERVITVGTNKAMYYDAGGADYIVTPSFAIPDTGVLTISVWMNSVINMSTTQAIIGEHSQNVLYGYILFYRSQASNKLSYQYTNGASVVELGDSSFFVGLDNDWVHVMVTCDYAGKTLKIYKNGSLSWSNQNMTTPLFPKTNRIKYIGSYSSGTYRLLNQYLDDVRIYNRALSASEISQIYNATKSRYD